MDTFEGTLLVPPDRGQILGRAVWKARHIVVGPRPSLFRDNQIFSQSSSSSRIISSGSKQPLTQPPAPPLPSDDYVISIYKSKNDPEPYQQWSLACVTECQVQMLAKRKQGPVLPTLLITLTDRERKRRSSRAGSFIPMSKDSCATALWFRAPPEDHQHTLQDWARFIVSKRGIMTPDESPITPTSSTQKFSPRAKETREIREALEYFPRPGSGHHQHGRNLHHKSSTATYSTGTKDRPVTFGSESPSLRSKRSDVSSPSSNYPVQQYAYVPGQHYTTVLPTDLPSPVNTTGDYKGEAAEAWAAAGGAPIQPGRESASSNAPPSEATTSSSPPTRETLLDRAFQMRYLQGGDRSVPGEEKLSSVARFDALMREADDRRRQREAAVQRDKMALRSTFEADDSSESEEEEDDDDTDTDDGDFSDSQVRSEPSPFSPSAQRALHFLAGPQSPRSPRPSISRSPISFHADSLPPISSQIVPPPRPHTAHDKVRRDATRRSQSTQYLPSSLSSDLAASIPKVPEETTPRQSSSSTKRLSFTEFTKRLSSTSSLLLVQTNASAGSSQRSSDADVGASAFQRTTLRPPGPVPPPPKDREGRDDNDKHCSWRSSVGVVGAEGGFF